MYVNSGTPLSGNTGVFGNVTGQGIGGYGVTASYGTDLTAPDTYVGLAGSTYAGLFMGGNVGIGTTAPESDFHINQSGGNSSAEQTGGICLENDTYRWRIYNSIDFVRYNYSSDDGVTYTLKAYVASSDGAWTQVSDESLKTNVELMDNVLSNVQNLVVKKYHYSDNDLTGKKTIGLMAQEAYEIFPELISSEEDDGLLGIDYSGFGIIAIKAIQEQQEIINAVQSENTVLKNELATMKAEIQAIKEAMNK